MNTRCLLSIVFFLLFASSLFAFANPREWTPSDDDILGIPDSGSIQIDVQKLGVGHYKLMFSHPNVKFESVIAGKEEWTWIDIPGETRNWTPGKPLVPAIARPVLYPNTGNVAVRVIASDYIEYRDIDVLPQQPLPVETKDGYRDRPFTIDRDFYSKDHWFPEELVKVSEPQILRDARIGLLNVQPVAVNPGTRTVRVYTSIEIETVPTGGIGINEIRTAPHPSPTFAQFYREIIGADELTELNANALFGQTVIVCRLGTVSQIQPFVDWRNQSGRPTQLIISTSTDTSVIRNQLLNIYNSPAGLDNVILAADAYNTNDNFSLPAYQSSYTYTDHQFVCLSGNDILADAYISRWPANNASQLQLMINRSINYERQPNMTDSTWFRRGWGYAGVSNDVYSNRTCIWYCMSMMAVRGVPPRNINYDEHNGHVDASLISIRCNPGMLFLAHRASWIGQISSSDLSGISTNINKCFVAFNITCSTGDYYGASSSGIHETLVKLGTPTAPCGAIAAMSSETSSQTPSNNNCMAAGTYYGLGVKNARQPGGMYFEGKYQMWRNFWNYDPARVTDILNWYNVMGDISVNMWTGVPRHLSTTMSTLIPLHQNTFEFQVNRTEDNAIVPNALVTVQKYNSNNELETYARGVTDARGQVNLPLTNRTTGTMIVTVIGNKVGDNYLPRIDTVVVTTLPGELVLNRLSIIDNTGNGRIGNNNQIANPGEIIDLRIQLANRGSRDTLRTIRSYLTSDDPRIVVIDSLGSYPNLAPSDTAYNAINFRIAIATNIRNGDHLPLHLRITTADSQYRWTYPISLPIQSIQLRYFGSSLTPARLNPDVVANLAISVMNTSDLTVQTSQARLISLSPQIEVHVSNAIFPSLPSLLTVTNLSTQQFQIHSARNSIPGTHAGMMAIFQCDSLRDTLYFTVTIGVDGDYPTTLCTGPDSYGYMAFDDTDTSYFLHPTYQWIDNETLANRLNLNDPVESTDSSVLIRLPFHAQHYGIIYDTITVCTNGWFSFGPARVIDALNGSHLQYTFRNRALPGPDVPPNMVAVDWQDLLIPSYPSGGVFGSYDSSSHAYVITWKGITYLNGFTGPNEFQVLIYNPQSLRVPSSDCILKFQYKTRSSSEYLSYPYEPGFTTIGICDSSRSRALQYVFWHDWSNGAAVIPDGVDINRAITFATSASFVSGRLIGDVTQLSDGRPIQGAVISSREAIASAVTDSNGQFRIDRFPSGTFPISIQAFGYIPITDTVRVRDSSTTTVHFTMRKPILRITLHPQDTVMAPNDSLYARLSTGGQDTTLHLFLRNTGNGPLTWNLTQSINPNGSEEDSLFSSLASINPSSLLINDPMLSGVEYDGEHFWISGASPNYARPHKLYKLDRTGTQLLNTYNCPDSVGVIGWRDLAFDGRYLYGSYDNHIDRIDTGTGSVLSRIPIQFVSVARSITIDTANRMLYYADQNSPIYKLNLANNSIVGDIPAISGLFGLAWFPADPDGMKLYAYYRDQQSHTTGTRLVKINPTTGTSRILASLGSNGDAAYGLAITNTWNPTFWVAIALMSHSNSDIVGIYKLAVDRSWIQVSPVSGELLANQLETVSISMTSTNLPVRYSDGLRISNNSSVPLVYVPIVMNVFNPNSEVTQTPEQLPLTYSLLQNRPNPFNPVTSITFSVPRMMPVSLSVYNNLGQVVASLSTGKPFAAGKHTVTFDGSSLANGVYFYRLEAGTFSATRKMVLLK